MTEQKNIRNIAIIAHVDHGKTTLVDEMLKQGGIYRENQATVERVMDSGDLERERGITILAKNTAVHYKGTKINIVDTPGHADFGGEVERTLEMVNGVLLLVDAAEGPMPQTRFVLQKALELGHKVIVVINKVDRLDARIEAVIDEVLELLLDLNATQEQFDSPTLFCSARYGIASYGPTEVGADLAPLFETIVNYIPAPQGDAEAPLQVRISSIDYNEYVGRIGIGRIERGTVRQNQEVAICDYHDPAHTEKGKIVTLYVFDGLGKTAVSEASAGEIVAFSGMADITIGRTICAPGFPAPLPFAKISDPTIEMTFSVNDSPFAGKEGKYVTSRNLRDRLEKELLKDVSLHVTEQGTDAFNVAGRGEMHLSILIETMRREGYEFQVSTPRVLMKDIDGKRCEPCERMVADVPETAMGSVIEKMGKRRGDLLSMTPVGSRYRLEFLVPSRGLFGYRNEFLTDTRGEGIMSSVLDSYKPLKGEIDRRNSGSLIAFESGESSAYGLFNAQERGVLFIGAGTPVYAGMVIGVCARNEDMTVNVCKKKQLTNMRASGSDEALRLNAPRTMSLEQCLEYLADDELLEVTPSSLRIRKRQLDHAVRMRQTMKSRQ
ncbi:MAG: translational GTPase TypA [Oscillospiraceae bacterium]|jgi:GTP-binding protein|nr:translational GTPase TypA [Oscillospiraceae bacterium]